MNLSPLPIQKFFDNNGAPLVGGLLFTYIAGTSTKIATYKDSTGGASNTNPIVLDYRGEANVWLDPLFVYKFTLAPKGDTDPPTKPIWTVDQITSAVSYADLLSIITATVTQDFVSSVLYPRSAFEILTGVTPNSAERIYVYGDPRRSNFLYTNQNWLDYGDAATFISTTSYSMVGDVTAKYPTQRRVKVSRTDGSYILGRITQAVFALGITTFTIAIETGNVPNPIGAVSLGMALMADDPGCMAYDMNLLPTGPFVWNKSNGANAVSRFCIFAGTSGLGSDVGLAIVVLQNSYGAFPYITGGPSGRQVILHTGVAGPISVGVFDVCKITFTSGNNPTQMYTDVNVQNNQAGAASTVLAVDSGTSATARLAMRVAGAEKGFINAAATEVLLGTNSAIDVSFAYNGARILTFNGANNAAAATPTLTANKPGANAGVITWVSVKSGAGTQGWIPIFGN